MDNILENDGVYIPDPDIDILVPNTRQPSAETTQIDPEKPRNFPDEVVKELQEAGLLETDFNKILNKYIVSSVRRAKLKTLQILIILLLIKCIQMVLWSLVKLN